MPRPKPAEPWVNIVVRLTPDQAAAMRLWAKHNGQTVSGAFRSMADALGGKPVKTAAFKPIETPKDGDTATFEGMPGRYILKDPAIGRLKPA